MIGVDAPLGVERGDRVLRRCGGRRQVLRDVETDAPRPDDGDPAAGRHPTGQHVGIGADGRMVGARNVEGARAHAVGDHDRIEAREVFGVRGVSETDLHAEILDPPGEVAHRLVELFLAGNRAREVELPAEPVPGFEERHRVAPLGRGHGSGETGRTGARDGHPLRRTGGNGAVVVLVAGLRIDQAGRRRGPEDPVEAGLVAGDAGVDPVRPARCRLGDELGIGEERPGERDEIGVSRRQDRLGGLGRVDAVGDHHRNPDRALEPRDEGRPGGARNGLGDGRYAGLVPADA